MDNSQFRKSNRLPGFDYASVNYYFVTVCTKDRAMSFGEVIMGEVCLNEVGLLARQFWKTIPEHYKNISLDEFIVMPNHVHGIVIVQPGEAANGRPYTNISTIVGSYKNIVSKEIHKQGALDFVWQKSFYDHVVRKDESLDKIRVYIRNNPLKWELDRNNPENLWM